MNDRTILLSILKDQVKPALGCTEPIAVAYAVAKAKEVLEKPVEKVSIKVDRNVFKNALAVYVPGTNQKGIAIAAALALVCGNADYKLEVLRDVTKKDLAKAKKLLEKDIIDIDIKNDVKGLYIEVVVMGSNNNAKVVLQNFHDNIVLIEQNGKILFTKREDKKEEIDLQEVIQRFNIKDIYDFAISVDIDELELVEKGIKMNMDIAQAWIEEKPSLKQKLKRAKDKQDMDSFAKTMTVAACDARMRGFPLPVMSCAGSGNHGIEAIVPIFAIGDIIKKEAEAIIRATTLSLLITVYIKSYTGALSPVCGCGVAAGIGASTGIAYLLGGDLETIQNTIKNMVGGIAGLLCDGGKPGCSFKLAISTSAAIDAAKMAQEGITISSDDGIVDETAEKSIQNLGKVSTKGMVNTDDTILEIMLAKCP